MKYTPPNTESYESGLTAKLLVDRMEGLVREHVIRRGTTRHDAYKLKQSGLGKLWQKLAIRTELEEFVKSYFFDNLGEPLSGFAEIFKAGNGAEQREFGIAQYIGKLAQEYGTEYDSVGTVSRLLSELQKRGAHFFEEVKKTKDTDGLTLIKGMTNDAFGQLLPPIYGKVQLALDFVQPQS